MKKSYTENRIVNIRNGGTKAVAGRNYRKGEIVDKNIFITDKVNAVHSELFKANNIVPIGIINYYTASTRNVNVELYEINSQTRYVTTRAVTNINIGDILTYKSVEYHTPVSSIGCNNYVDISNIPNSGSGLFAGKNYSVGETVMINPFIISRPSSEKLNDYVFKGKAPGTHHNIFIQGEISLMNHSQTPNVYPYNFDYNNRCAIAKAMRNIKQGEELFISYGDSYWTTRNKGKSINNSKIEHNPVSKQESKEESKQVSKEVSKQKSKKDILSKINSRALPHSLLFNNPLPTPPHSTPVNMPKQNYFRSSNNGMLW